MEVLKPVYFCMWQRLQTTSNYNLIHSVRQAQALTHYFFTMLPQSRIRGQLGTIFMNARNFGILIAFTLGTYFDYITSSLFFIAITIVFLVAISFVPSTPQYFLQKNQIEPSQKAFNFYNQHRLQSDPKYCVSQFQKLSVVAKMVETDSKIAWKDIGEYWIVFASHMRWAWN